MTAWAICSRPTSGRMKRKVSLARLGQFIRAKTAAATLLQAQSA